MTILHVLGDKILKSPSDAPVDILRRLISTLDRCASRTRSLPIETVELMPLHCSKFSKACLQKLFSLSSYDNEATNWNSTRSEVAKISVMILLTRCEHIFDRYLLDEKELGMFLFKTIHHALVQALLRLVTEDLRLERVNATS